MERRTMIGAMIAAVASSAAGQTPAKKAGQAKGAAPAKRPIQLNCDLAVDPKQEDAFIKHFETVFRPVAQKHEGYIDLKLLRIDLQIRGNVPAGCRVRFSLTYQTEELRQKWIAHPDHEKAWAPMEAMLTDHNFNILVYDVY